MKKVLICAAVLLLALAATAFAGREEIDAAINSFEAVVVEAETLAEKYLLFDGGEFAAIDEKVQSALAAIDAAKIVQEWTIQDTKRSMELRIRFNTAMATAIDKLFQIIKTDDQQQSGK